MMNAKSRKGYLDRMRKDLNASLCPACGRKTRHLTVPSKDGAGLVDIICEYCEKIVKPGVKGLPPYASVRLTQDILKGAEP